MKLFMSGQKFIATKEPPQVTKIRKFLDNSKRGELFTSNQLASAFQTSVSVLRHHSFRLEELGYTHFWKNKRYWGNKATITQFKKEVTNGNS